MVQTYDPGRAAREDVELLTFVGSHIATALTRARAIEETRQRNAELALINEIGEALSRQLEFDAIIELVGERVRSIFDAESMFIAIYDRRPNGPLPLRDRQRRTSSTAAICPGGGSDVASSETGQSVRTRPRRRWRRRRDRRRWLDHRVVAGRAHPGRRRGSSASSAWRTRPHAFSEADERVLITLASSMGVALENARLFDETRRLLAETNERAAELAIINSVQQGLAAKLDMQSMYDLVGDKIQEIFDAQVVDIGIYDFEAGVDALPVRDRARASAIPDEPSPITGVDARRSSPRASRRSSNDVPAWERETGDHARSSRASRRSRSSACR